MKITPLLVSSALLGLAATASHAELLVQESWDYGVGSATTTWNGGTGFETASWSAGTTGASIVGQISFGGMNVSGNTQRINFTAGGGFSSSTLGRSLNLASSISSGDLWMSYLYQFDTASSTIPADEALQVRPGAGNIRTGIDEDNSQFYQRYGSDTTNSTTNAIFKDGTKLLLVFKFPDLGSATGADAKGWALTEGNYGSLLTAGITEANLNSFASSTVTNSFSANETVSGNVTFQIVPIGRNSSTPSFFFDELKLGTALGDVVAVPEPSSAALIGLGVIGLIALRRARQRHTA